MTRRPSLFLALCALADRPSSKPLASNGMSLCFASLLQVRPNTCISVADQVLVTLQKPRFCCTLKSAILLQLHNRPICNFLSLFSKSAVLWRTHCVERIRRSIKVYSYTSWTVFTLVSNANNFESNNC